MFHSSRFCFLIVGPSLFLVPLGYSQSTAPGFAVVEPKCEGRENPLGIDDAAPWLSWLLTAGNQTVRGLRQTAYQVLVASDPALLAKDQGDPWDSGNVESEAMNQIAYAGKPLTSSAAVYWKVRVWAETLGAPATAPSPWSAPDQWTMGVLLPKDWTAKWITAPSGQASSLLLRRDFAVKPKLRRAVVQVTGLGHFELFLNGTEVGTDLLAPGWTDYKKTVLYCTYDVTTLLKPGTNAAGLILGNGMYNITDDKQRYVKFTQSFGPLKAIAQLSLDYADGTSELVATDSGWSAGPSPVTYNNVYGGEDRDARLEPAGWSRPGFKADAAWEPSLETTGPGGTLKGLSASAPPLREIEILKPTATRNIQPSVTVYDLGQNASLMPRLTVSGPAGSVVRIIPSELLKPDGSVDRTSSTQDKVRPAWWQYTLAGSGEETWFPQFFYNGARYLQVELSPAAPGGSLPSVQQIEGVVVHSSAPVAGSFSCSNPLFNRFYSLVRWAQRSNMVSVLTDCPTREKLGWLEETHLNGPALRYNFDLFTLYRKLMNDMADSQLENGFVPNIAPEYFIAGPTKLTNGFRNSPEWGGAFLMVAWQQFQFSGDISHLREHYEKMKRYVAFLGSTAEDDIVSTGLGDWCDIGPKPSWGAQLTLPPFTATAFYQHFNWILARIAELLGKREEAVKYEGLAWQIRASFNRKFFHPDTHEYGSQCANSLAIIMELVEPADRAAVLDALVADVREKGLTVGDVGYRYLLRALADNGRSDVIYELNNQSDKPGYGYQVKQGATSLTEKWDTSISKGFGSQNHFMLGQINEWFFHDLAGIQSDPAGPGFKKIVIKPAVVGDLTQVRASYNSAAGKIASEWNVAGKMLTLSVVVPANTTATIYVPTSSAGAVNESGKPAAASPGVQLLRNEDKVAVFAVGSGSYTFASKIP